MKTGKQTLELMKSLKQTVECMKRSKQTLELMQSGRPPSLRHLPDERILWFGVERKRELVRRRY